MHVEEVKLTFILINKSWPLSDRSILVLYSKPRPLCVFFHIEHNNKRRAELSRTTPIFQCGLNAGI